MKHFSFKLAALALAGVLAASTGAQAGGLYDDDDTGYSNGSGNGNGNGYGNGGYSGSYNRQSLRQYCYENPYDDACEDYRPQRKTYKKSYGYGNGYGNGNGRCAALIRAVGKRNLVTAFARNSARFAWRREVRAVHGDQYSDWGNARGADIDCTHYGALKSCVAVATPCRD
jgi:hypothetical protein